MNIFLEYFNMFLLLKFYFDYLKKIILELSWTKYKIWMKTIFIRPSSDVGRIMVWWCPSVRVSVRPSIRPSVSPSQFSALFSYMLWHIDLTPVFRRDELWYGDVRPSVRVSVRPSIRPSVTVFRTFLLHALTYWSEILCITSFLCT